MDEEMNIYKISFSNGLSFEREAHGLEEAEHKAKLLCEEIKLDLGNNKITIEDVIFLSEN